MSPFELTCMFQWASTFYCAITCTPTSYIIPCLHFVFLQHSIPITVINEEPGVFKTPKVIYRSSVNRPPKQRGFSRYAATPIPVNHQRSRGHLLRRHDIQRRERPKSAIDIVAQAGDVTLSAPAVLNKRMLTRSASITSQLEQGRPDVIKSAEVITKQTRDVNRYLQVRRVSLQFNLNVFLNYRLIYSAITMRHNRLFHAAPIYRTLHGHSKQD